MAAVTINPCLNRGEREIDSRTRNVAYTIVAGKGSTYYGIGAGLSRIVSAIRDDERAVLTVSTRTTDVPGCEAVSLSLPRVVGLTGAVMTLRPVLTAEEVEAIQKSAHVLRGVAEALNIGQG